MFLPIIEKWTTLRQQTGDPRRSPGLGITNPYPPEDRINAPMDMERAIDEFDGDKNFLMEVVAGFTENVNHQIGVLHEAISDGDTKRVYREAHSIKGGAANLTASTLSNIASELSTMGKSGELNGGYSLLGKLEREFRRLEIYTSDSMT